MSDDGKQGNKDDKNEGPTNIEKQRVNGLGLVGQLMSVLAAPIVLFTLIGKYLDNLFEKRFLFILLGGAFGIGIGMHFVYKRAQVIREDLYGRK